MRRWGTTTRPRGCSTATSTAGRGDAGGDPVRRRVADLRRAAGATCGGPSTRSHELGVAPGDRVALVVNDEPAFLAWFLGAMRSGVVPVAAVDDAHRRRPGRDRGRRRRRARRRVERVRRPIGRISPRRRPSSTPSSRTSRAPTTACRCTRWDDFTDTTRAARRADPAGLPGVLALQLRTTGCPRASCTATAACRRPPTRTRRKVLGSRATTGACRSPSCSSPTGSATR